MSTLYGLLGESLGHSLSPIIHKEIFDFLGIQAYYHLFEVERGKLGAAVTGLKVLGAAGVNVTIPYKSEVMQYLDHITPEAASIGSVNTISFNKSVATGSNTDYYGFGKLLERYSVETEGADILVLGHGGGAKAVIKYLLDHGAKSITVAVRNTSLINGAQGATLSDRLVFTSFESLSEQNKGDLIVNCTPCGMYPRIMEMPVASEILKGYKTAVDLIYNPQKTMFLKCSEEAGLKAVNGLYMLVGQAVAAQELWNNVQLCQKDVDRVYDMASAYLQKSVSP